MKIILFICIFALAFVVAKDPKIKKEGNYLVSKHEGPFDYHVDLSDPFRLVDGANQLMAVGSMMLTTNPSTIFDIGLGMGCLPRHFLNRYPNLRVKSTDTDYKIIQNFGEMNNVYLAQNAQVQSQMSRLAITPSDSLVLLETVYQKDRFDVVWVDILDERHYGEQHVIKKHMKKNKEAPRKRSVGEESTGSILYEADFYASLRKQVNNGIVVSLYKSTPEDIAAIKQAANMKTVIQLTFAQFDPVAQKHFSVLVLSNGYLNCADVAKSASAFSTNNIQTPICKKL